MIYDRGWKTPPASLKLLDDEVHVWRVSLLQSESTLHDLEQVLGIEEVTRAKRFVFEKECNRLITSHGCLRMLLGHYLNTEPNLLRFSTNAYGKPFLDLPSQRHTLHFNFSHSHNLALYAFAYARQLGIDVEYMRSDIEYEELAKHFFSSVEN